MFPDKYIQQTICCQHDITVLEQVFGRRQTFWDTALQLISSQSQESNLLTAFVRLICTVVVNFTLGMLCSVFMFAFQLPSMVMSYQVESHPDCVLSRCTYTGLSARYSLTSNLQASLYCPISFQPLFKLPFCRHAQVAWTMHAHAALE